MNRVEYQLAKNHKWSDLKLSEPIFAVVVPFNDGYGEEVTTNAATGIATNKATLNGTLVWGLMPGGQAYCNFQWGETTDYDYYTDAQLKSPEESFSAQITGLKPNTVYHFRAKTGYETAHGADKTFRTKGGGNINVDQLIYQHAERMKR